MADGRIVTNEQTGQQAWWDGSNLTPIQVAPGTQMQPGDVQAAMAGKTEPLGPEFANLPPVPDAVAPKIPSQRPRFPGAEQFLEQAAGPVFTGLAGLTPGGLATQMAIGGGTEIASQKLAGEDPLDPKSLLRTGIATATAPVARGLGATFKPIARGAAKVFGKEKLVEGGLQKLESVLGKKSAEKAAAETLETAKGVTAPVAQGETGKVVLGILGKKGRIAGEDETAIKTAEEILSNAKASHAAGEPIRYNELFEQARNMRKLAGKAKGGDKGNFIDLHEAMMKDLAKVGPEAGEAVKAYRFNASIDDVTEAIRKATPERTVRDVLLDPLVKGAFTKEQENTIKLIAGQIGNVGLLKIAGSVASLGALGFGAGGITTGGAAAIVPAIMGALVSVPRVGPVMARSLIGAEGKVNAAAIPALAQMVRGYLASQPQEEPQQ